jgi:hypothetical protein
LLNFVVMSFSNYDFAKLITRHIFFKPNHCNLIESPGQ